MIPIFLPFEICHRAVELGFASPCAAYYHYLVSTDAVHGLPHPQGDGGQGLCAYIKPSMDPQNDLLYIGQFEAEGATPAITPWQLFEWLNPQLPGVLDIVTAQGRVEYSVFEQINLYSEYASLPLALAGALELLARRRPVAVPAE